MQNIFIPWTILPIDSDPPANSPTVCNLCCSLANPSARASLSLRQVVGFDTSHKQVLQADYLWL